MAEFKEGQKVRIDISQFKGGNYKYGIGLHPYMFQYDGDVDVVTGKCRNGRYRLNYIPWSWEGDWLKPVSEPKESDKVTAHSVLLAASQHMIDRAKTYDKADGERSMGATVKAFNAITGHSLSETQGWLFMALLKATRACQRDSYHADSFEDMAAYVGLAAEAKANEQE